MSKLIDLTGQDFGYWHVLERAENDKSGRELEEIINNQNILTMSLFCSFFQEEPSITRHFLNSTN